MYLDAINREGGLGARFYDNVTSVCRGLSQFGELVSRREHTFESSIDDNRPFSSCILPQFENESLSETIQMKMSLIFMKMDVQVNTFSYECFRTKTRFGTEVKGNSELVHLVLIPNPACPSSSNPAQQD